jgi:hypothetical protein
MYYVGLAHGFEDTCLHEEYKVKAVEKVSGGRSTRLAGHLAPNRLIQVSRALPRLYKYPPPPYGGNEDTP